MNKLYEQEPYQTLFDATLISCTKQENRYDIVLDQTLFFPEEGGQTCDQGTLNNIEVIDVQIIDGILHHYTKKPLQNPVHGQIDWNHRYMNMQNHTGEHILSGILHRYYHVDNVGFHLGYNEITADYPLELTQSQLQDIEQKVNQVIFENHTVKTYYLEDYTNVHYRAKLNIAKPRLVEIEGVDLCACCAPHVKSTAEVGLFKIIKTMKIKKGTRIYFLCGQKAYQDYALKHEQTNQISTLLSASNNTLSNHVQRLLDENHALKNTITNLHKQIIDTKTIPFQNNQIVLCEDMERETQLYYFNKLLRYAKQHVLLVSKQESNYRFMTNSKEIFEALKKHHLVKGGGNKNFYQGTIDQIDESFFISYK